jgi:hypothetical protein
VPTRTWDSVEDARSRIPRRSRQGTNIRRKEEKRARAGELAFRSGVRSLTPATAGGSVRNLPARLTDKCWLHVVVGDVCHGQRKERQHEETLAARVTQAGAYPSGPPVSRAGASWSLSLSSSGSPPVVTSRGRKRLMSRDVNRLRPRPRAARVGTASCLTSRVRKRKETKSEMATIWPFSSPIEPHFRRPQPALAVTSGQTQAVRLVTGGGVWLAAGM